MRDVVSARAWRDQGPTGSTYLNGTIAVLEIDGPGVHRLVGRSDLEVIDTVHLTGKSEAVSIHGFRRGAEPS